MAKRSKGFGRCIDCACGIVALAVAACGGAGSPSAGTGAPVAAIGGGGEATGGDGGAAGGGGEATGGGGGAAGGDVAAIRGDGGTPSASSPGSRGSGTIAVTVDPPVLTASYRGYEKSSRMPAATFHLAFSRPVSATACVQITEDASVLSKLPLDSVERNLDDTYSGRVMFNEDLAPGQYSGTLTFELYEDEACTSAYNLTGNEVGYSLNVVEPATLSVAVDGTPADLDGLTVPSGSTLRFDVSEPATISWGSSGVIVTNEVKTSTSWQGLVKNGLQTGTPELIFMADIVAAPPQGLNATVLVTP